MLGMILCVMGSKVDNRGQNLEFIPFGAGRRVCAGLPRAHREPHHILGSLLLQFEADVNSIGIDMENRTGIALRKPEP